MKKNRFFILSSLASLFIASVAYGSLPVSLKQNPSNLLISQALNRETIQEKAQAISVKVETDNSAGSGVIIGKEGNTYTVLTNAHVINSKADNTIITNDGESYTAKVISEGNSLEGNDLAVLTFESVNSYQVATLAVNTNLEENSTVYSVGFPEETEQFYFTQGSIKKQASKPFIGGYQIGYDIEVKSGMSGGALLNEKGELIGVNGLLQNPILDDAYTYLDGSRPYEQHIESYRDLSFAVPIQTLMAVAPNLAFIPNEWKVGLNIAEKVDNIARQITVRIDSDKEVIGSGVIVGKEGDTYYVLTACHVVYDYNESENHNSCEPGKINSNYTLVTPDGIRHDIQSQDIILPKGIDAAIVKFKSKNLYQLATIGQYNIPISRRQWVFVSGFPGELNGLRKFTPGYRFQRERGLAVLFDQQKLDINISGYELVYSNLTYKGMSGGPVLDTNGHVIGINTGEEGQQITLTETRQLGYAHGVPASTLLKFAEDKNVNTTSFNISNQVPTPLNENESKSLKQHPAFVVEKPPSNASETDWLNYGNNLWRLERSTEAISAFKTAIQLNENLAEPYYALGLAYAQQNKDETNLKAIEAFEQVIPLTSNWYLKGKAWYQKAIVLDELGKTNEALVAINEGIKQIEDEPKFYLEKASILDKLKRYPDAINAYTQAIEIQSSGIAYFQRSLVYGKIGEYQKALNDCNQSLELGLIEGYFCEGRIHDALGNYEQSINAYNKLIEFDSTDTDYYILRGGLYRLLKNDPKAIADYTKAIELDPQNDLLYFVRGNYYFLASQGELAVKDMSKAIEIKPDKAQYYYDRAKVKIHFLKDYEGAMEDVNEAIKLKPNYASAYSSRAEIHNGNLLQQMRELQSNTNLTEQEKFEKAVPIIKLYLSQAIADLDKAIEIAPKYGGAYYERGNYMLIIASVSNKKDQLVQNALKDFNKAIELMNDPTPGTYKLWIGELPEDFEMFSSHILQKLEMDNNDGTLYAFVYRDRGNLLLKMNDTQGALEDYTKAISLDPENADLYKERSEVYRRLNEPEKAREDANKAIELSR
ncbi:serine protease [Crocosphaera sp.]|uniref:tetratricopeptide repeat-containing S1 family peptidase n=1 Tax=Crocosphaera sp. TaxID=2729996 RepID=UPI002620EADB|nr:serine protease [Crocosphaera sp.]MDJ0578701.1 tetratricopeptide repeat protein [Crocosphaera sp.]